MSRILTIIVHLMNEILLFANNYLKIRLLSVPSIYDHQNIFVLQFYEKNAKVRKCYMI